MAATEGVTAGGDGGTWRYMAVNGGTWRYMAVDFGGTWRYMAVNGGTWRYVPGFYFACKIR